MNKMVKGDALGSTGANVLLAGYAVHLDPFEADSPEGLTSYLIRLQTEGRAQALIDGVMVDVQPGDLLFFRPGEPYRLSVDGPQGLGTVSGDYYIFCSGSWLDAWWKASICAPQAHIALSEQTLQMWRQIVWQFRGASVAREQTMDYLLRALCLHLGDEQRRHSQHFSNLDARVAARIRAYLDQHAGHDVTLQEVAAYMGLSISRCVHVFKEVFARTIVQYLQEVRLQTACDRIRFSQMTLEEAAESSGFRSYSYFYRVFRSRYGMSPKQFRANLM